MSPPEPATVADDVSRWTLLTWASALSGPLAYALGRVVAETFYGRFAVLPGEIGLRYDSLVAPALIAVLLTAAAGAALILLGRLAIAVGGAAAGWTLISAVRDGWVFSWHGAGVLVLVLLALALLAGVGRLEGEYGGRLWLAVIVVLAVTVAVLSVSTAYTAADDAQAGRAVSLNVVGLPVDVVRATPARLSGVTLPGAGPSPCVLLLGSADGVTVLLHDGVAWRVPSDSANTVTGC